MEGPGLEARCVFVQSARFAFGQERGTNGRGPNQAAAPIQSDRVYTLSGDRHGSAAPSRPGNDWRQGNIPGASRCADCSAETLMNKMKGLRILALVAVGVSCHLDKLLNGGGGGARPLSNGTPVGLMFSSIPRAPHAGPLGPVQVSVVDSGGQPVAGVDSITVTIALGSNPGGAPLGGTPNAHPARGVATFADLRLDRAASGYVLTATASGLASATSDTFTVMPGPAVRLTFTVEPNSPVSQGNAVTPPVAVTALDSLGNTATNFTGTVRLALRQNGNTVNGGLSGATATAVRGVATFGNLQINNAGSYTLTAAFGGAAPVAESAPFTVAPPGPPPPPTGNIALTTATTGSNPPSGYTVSVDGTSAGTIGINDSITISPVPAGTHNVALGDVPTTCAVTGDNPVGVDVPAAGTAHAAFVVTCGAPPSPPPPAPGPYLLFTDEPVITQAGQPMNTVRVTVYDAAGNQDRTYTGPVTLSIGFNPSGGTLTGGGTITMDLGLGGVVQWERISIDQPGFGYTLHATSPGLRDAFSDPLDITAGPPPSANGANGLGFFSQPATVHAGDVIASLRVGALGPGGVVISAYSGPVWISLGTNPSGATLTGTRRLMAVNGFVTFSDLKIDKPGTGFILRATAWPLNYTLSKPFDVIAP